MKNYLFIIILLLNSSVFAECIHEKNLMGSQLVSLFNDHDIWIKNRKNQFMRLKSKSDIQVNRKYKVQFRKKQKQLFYSSMDDYNERYLPYYSVSRLKTFMKKNEKLVEKKGYRISVIGKSVKGEKLYYIGPQEVDYSKKTIVMFGRHHGDEGTANWIIEGFLTHFLYSKHLRKKYNLLLYPMINPDGANSRVRYNAKGRDLNRSWGIDSSKSLDEVASIYSHLEKQFEKIKRPVIVLDMHGSFDNDFIYRVDKSFKGLGFYNLQQAFITRLAYRDSWQNGNFEISNGSMGMSRIRLINRFGLNAMTHETPRDILRKNRRNRSVRSLMEQGVAIAYTIDDMY